MEPVGFRAFVRGGPMVILGVGPVPGRVVWLVAAVVGLVRVGPFRPKSLYGVQTLRRDGFVLIMISRDFYSCYTIFSFFLNPLKNLFCII